MTIPGLSAAPLLMKGQKPDPEFVGVTDAPVSTGPLVLAKVSAALPGDLQLAFIYFNPTSIPSGWTKIGGPPLGTSGNTLHTFMKIVEPSEPSTYSWGSASNGRTVAYRNVMALDGSMTYVDQMPSGTISIPGVTASAPGILVAAMIRNASGGVSTTSGMTARGVVSGSTGTPFIFDLIPSPPGATGSKSFTLTGGSVVCAAMGQFI